MKGVYAIRNVITGATYIGSSENIKKRWTVHRYCLRHRKDRRCPLLLEAWILYGEAAFEFFVLEECEGDSLREREQRWLMVGPQLNINLNARGGLNEISEAHKEAIRKHNREREITPAMIEAMLKGREGKPPSMLGKKHSKETIKKLREARRNRWRKKKQ